MKDKILWIALGVLAALLIGNTIVNRSGRSALSAAQDSLHVALRLGDNALRAADILGASARAAEARAATADSAATALAHRADRATVVYRTVRESAPTDCAPVIAAADSVISLEHARGDSLTSALQNERKALVDTRDAFDSVSAAYGRLRTAATTLDRAVQPSWREKLVPKFGIGAVAGIDPITRRPATAAGLTLGWTF